MRLFIDKGYLIQDREIMDQDGYPIVDKKGQPYFGLVAMQVYDERGAPALNLSYQGAGVLEPPRIILGDPYRSTQLLEGTVDRSATEESWNYFSGYKLAIVSKRPLTKKQEREALYASSQQFIDGYQEGVRDRRARGIRSSG